MKTKLTLLIAAALSLSLLATACTPKDDENISENGSETENVGTNEGDTDSEDEGEEALALPAAVPTENDQKIVMRVGGEDISLARYRYYFLNLKYSIDGGDESMWEDEALSVQLDDAITSELQARVAIDRLANELGVSLSEETKIANVDNVIAEEINAAGYETYVQQLEGYLLTDTLIRELYEEDALQNEIFGTSYLEGGSMYPATDEMILDYINENYVRVKHILIKTIDLDDEEKAEARKRADNILERAKNGENFENLVKEYSEDGMDPETGYYFTKGEMVQEFENESYALEVGEISDIVESTYGYHIIKKYEMEEDYILSDDTLKSAAESIICQKAYFDKLTNVAALLDVEYLDGFEEVKAQLLDESSQLYSQMASAG